MKTDLKIRKARRLLPHILSKKLPRQIVLVGVGLKTSQVLNRRYCNKNRPTNVLSFRYSPDYGEILLCPEVIRREAKEQGHTYKYQMTWMIIHGMLHLAGIHHEKSKKIVKKAERLERMLLAKIFIN